MLARPTQPRRVNGRRQPVALPPDLLFPQRPRPRAQPPAPLYLRLFLFPFHPSLPRFCRHSLFDEAFSPFSLCLHPSPPFVLYRTVPFWLNFPLCWRQTALVLSLCWDETP